MGRKKRLRKRIKGLEKQRDIHIEKQDQTTDEYLREKYYPKEIQRINKDIEETEKLLNRKKRKKRKHSDEDIVVVMIQS